jgi:hypothetical protein
MHVHVIYIYIYINVYIYIHKYESEMLSTQIQGNNYRRPRGYTPGSFLLSSVLLY